jgi:hypothetical protein
LKNSELKFKKDLEMNAPVTGIIKHKEISIRTSLIFLATFILFGVLSLEDRPSKNYSILDRTWGFDNIMLYDAVGKALFLFIALIIITPYTNNFLQRALFYLSEKLLPLRKRKVLLFFIVAVLALLLFYLARVKFYFLGDFNFRVIQTMKKEFVGTEYLTMRLLYSLATAAGKAGIAADQFFKLYSCFAGGVFVFISCRLSDFIGKNITQKMLLLSALLGSSLLLLFCGYVEIYATPAVLLLHYVYTGCRYIKNKGTFLMTFLSLALAIGSHLLCAAVAPSLLVLYYFRNREKFQMIHKLSNYKIAAIIGGGIVLAMAAAFAKGHLFLLPIKAPATQPTYLTFFSLRHIWEFFNGQFLCCGLSILLLPILLTKAIREKRILTGLEYFLLCVTGCLLLLVFSSNLQRGSGDWDIMSFPAITLNMTTVILILHLYENQVRQGLYLIMVITGLNILNAFLWININHTNKSIKKIESMLSKDPAVYYLMRISGQTQLAMAYKDNKLYREAERMALVACRNSPATDVRACVMYASCLRDRERIDEARAFLEDLLHTRTPVVLEAYLFLLAYYQKTENNERLIYYLNKLFDAFKQQPYGFINNQSFRPPVMIELFEALSKVEKRNNNEMRVAEIEAMISELKNLRRTTAPNNEG